MSKYAVRLVNSLKNISFNNELFKITSRLCDYNVNINMIYVLGYSILSGKLPTQSFYVGNI